MAIFNGTDGNDQGFGVFTGTGENGVMVNMLAGYARDTYGDFDTLIGIESVQGTNQIDVFTSGFNFTSFRGFGGVKLSLAVRQLV